jgi:hypothetical protein
MCRAFQVKVLTVDATLREILTSVPRELLGELWIGMKHKKGVSIHNTRFVGRIEWPSWDVARTSYARLTSSACSFLAAVDSAWGKRIVLKASPVEE